MKELKDFGNPVYHQLDVTEPQSIKELREFVENEYGYLDILINNAGINYDTHQDIEKADLKEVQETFETNTLAPWNLIQTFAPLLRKSTAARIVNVSSGSGQLDSQDGSTPGYSISKLALNGVTLAFANHFKKDNILVNSVCPGWVRTDMGGSNANRSPEKGAETIIWASLLEDTSQTGKFFRDKKEIEW